MTKFALAVDASEHSERAFKYYLENIHKEGNELLLIHALEYPYIPGTPYVRNDIVKDVFHKAEEQGTKLDIKYKELCQKHKIKCLVVTDFSNPGEFVVKKSDEHKAAMIIMGTRGMGKVRRTVLGSVSDYVLHHAHCPVLIARE